MNPSTTPPPGRIVVTCDDAIATVTLSNPARRNAISVPMWQALTEFARSTHERPEIRAVVIRGEGRKAFSGGADISGFAEARSGTSNARAYDDLVEEACVAIESMRCPSIALIHGACVGAGASVAASCDMRLAASGSFIAVPAARLGLGYDPRGIRRFLRVMGQAVAGEILFTADRFHIERAAATGAVAAVAPPDEIDARAAEIARRIASNAPITIAAAKAALRAHALADDALLEDAMQLYAQADASADYAEGRAAFLEKRPPQFKGR
jgi:enoyl-CoA hydratase